MRDVRLVAQGGSKPPSVSTSTLRARWNANSNSTRARRAGWRDPVGETRGLRSRDRPRVHAEPRDASGRREPPDASLRRLLHGLQRDARGVRRRRGGGGGGGESRRQSRQGGAKAAHLAEMEKKGAAAAPKAQLTRAERRAQQEAQKAAKAAKKEGGGDGAFTKKVAGGSAGDLQKVATGGAAGDEASSREPVGNVVGNPARQAQRVERAREAKASAKAKSFPTTSLSDHFSHLRPFDAGGEHKTGEKTKRASVNFGAEKHDAEHPAVSRVARLYADGTVSGGRARCAALLHTLKKVVESFEVPPDETYAHALTARVNARRAAHPVRAPDERLHGKRREVARRRTSRACPRSARATDATRRRRRYRHRGERGPRATLSPAGKPWRTWSTSRWKKLRKPAGASPSTARTKSRTATSSRRTGSRTMPLRF